MLTELLAATIFALGRGVGSFGSISALDRLALERSVVIGHVMISVRLVINLALFGG